MRRRDAATLWYFSIICLALVALPPWSLASDVPMAGASNVAAVAGHPEAATDSPQYTAPQSMVSPGVVVTSTLHDLQHLSSSGRQIDNAFQRLAASFTVGNGGLSREVFYWSGHVSGGPAPISLLSGGQILALPITTDYGFPYGGSVRPGFPTMNSLPDSGILMAYHDYVDGLFLESFPVAAIEVLPGVGVLFGHDGPQPSGRAQSFMFRSDLDQVGTDIVLHLVASSPDSAFEFDNPNLYYWRGIVDTSGNGSMSWSAPVLMDSNHQYASAIVEASGSGDQVAIVYTKAVGTAGTVNSNVWYRLSSDGGINWGTAVNLTGFAASDTDVAFTHVEAVYDEDNTLHVLYNTAPPGLNDHLPAKLWHWNSVRQTSRLVIVADWVNTCSFVASDYGNFNDPQVSKPSLSVKPAGAGPGGGIPDEILYALWVQFGPTEFDCATMDDGVTTGGRVNADLWWSASSDDGLTWDRPSNITGSPTPNCTPGNCFSEHWVSAASVADSGVYISYMSDTHPGSYVQNEGVGAAGDAMVLALASRAAGTSPRISVLPRVIPYPLVIMGIDYWFDLQPFTTSVNSFALEVRNLGTANLSVLMTVSSDDMGNEHLFINGDSTFSDVLLPGEELTGNSALMLSYDGIGLQDGDTFEWLIYIESNDPDVGVITLHFLVDVSGPSAQISGAKFDDANLNGVWDFPAESGLPDWVIHAEPGGYVDTTDLTGAYFFSELPAGTYTVSEEQQPGWAQTSPGGAGTHNITLADGEPVDSVYFGNFEVDCLIQVPGDVNVSGSVTSADIIYMVGFVFKGQAAPLPCEANGDVNCSGAVTSADIIYLVGFVFKGQAPPCDICAGSPLPCQ